MSLRFFLTLIIITSCTGKKTDIYKITDFTKGDGYFSIHIKDPNQSLIKIKSYGFFKDPFLDDEGKLTDTLKNITESYFTFSDRLHGAGFYIKPGKHVKVKLDTKSFLNTIEFSGDLATENNYLKKYFILNRDIARVNAIQHLAYQDEKTFKRKIDSIRDLRLKLLKDYDKKNKLDEHFKYLEENRIFYEWANRMETYEAYRQFALEDTTFKVSPNFYDFRKKINLENRNLIIVPSYHYYLENYYQKIANNNAKNENESFIGFLEIVGKQVKDTIIKNRLLFAYADMNLKNVKDKNKFFKTFKKYATDQNNIAKIQEKYVELNRLNPGMPAPDFSLVNENGKKVSLKDLRGKYVYIDVWATWCRPCIAEMPYLEKLKEKYKDAAIEFVGINVNDLKVDWLNYINKMKPKGINLYAGDNPDFKDDYQVYQVPKSILINPYGYISTANAPRPSETELIELLFDRIKTAYK